MDNWNFSSIKTNKRSINKWRKYISSNTIQHDYIMKVIDDAINKRSVTYSTRYYSCARFVLYYNALGYNFLKKPIVEYTCCNAYPIICGGVCCKNKFMRIFDYDKKCGCDNISNNAKKIGMCYDDCCCFYKIIDRHKFKIVWI